MTKETGKASKYFAGWVLFAVAVLALTGVEFCYFLSDGSTLKRAAGLTWIIVSAGFLLFVTMDAFRLFFKVTFWRDKDKFWYLTAFFLPIFLVYFDAWSVTWTRINDEGTQQVAQGLDLLKHDPDFGIYRLTYFVGYIARQYELTCLPTYFFGPSLLALRIGNSFIYLGSYLVFLAAMANYFRVRGALRPLLLASFAGMMVSLGGYPLVQARGFEQSTMPMGAMMLFLAGVFNFLSNPTPFRTFWVAWSFGFFAEGYTPALGGWGMALFVLLYLAVHPKHNHRILWVPILYGSCCLLVACLVMAGESALGSRFHPGPDHFTASDWIWHYFVGFHSLLSSNFSVIPCPLGLAGLAALYFSLRFRDYRFPLLCLWCLAAAFVSLTCSGSNFNLPQYDIQRSMIILPALAAGVVVFYHVFSSQGAPSNLARGTVATGACVAMIYMICTGVAVPLTMRVFIYDGPMSDYDEALYKIDCVNYDSKGEGIKKLYIVPPLRIDDLETGLVYFSPSTVVIRGNPPPGEKEAGTYLLSYLSDNVEDRQYDPIIPSLHRVPICN